ncbi:uncharacterized protein LOC102290532 [Haplochromis burtoni]|uniref:uncharacterized protein LOC102290532 n=1 Tax=Haplochromis burtoni TaxID=8153 RepID=UPI001C2D0AA1|nr:uncharacterized protein LOC102290532 [Haplochromis burtoni]
MVKIVTVSQSHGEPQLYRLYAVLVHSELSCHAGHYFCYIKASNEQWFQMNDSSVSVSDISTVLNQQAYVLFYIKCTDVGKTEDYSRLNHNAGISGQASPQPVVSPRTIATMHHNIVGFIGPQLPPHMNKVLPHLRVLIMSLFLLNPVFHAQYICTFQLCLFEKNEMISYIGLQTTSAMEARKMLMNSCGAQWMLCKGPAYLELRNGCTLALEEIEKDTTGIGVTNEKATTIVTGTDGTTKTVTTASTGIVSPFLDVTTGNGRLIVTGSEPSSTLGSVIVTEVLMEIQTELRK